MNTTTDTKGTPLYPAADDGLGVITSKGNSHPFDGSDADWLAFGTVCNQRDQLAIEAATLRQRVSELEGALQKFVDTADMQKAGGQTMLLISFSGPALHTARALLTKEGGK